MSRVVVTGGAGRLGRSVVAVLASAGHEVVSVDLMVPETTSVAASSRTTGPGAPSLEPAASKATSEGQAVAQGVIDWVRRDLGDTGATRELFRTLRPDAVVHLAGIAVPFSRPDAEIYGTNTRLGWSVLEAALDSGARQLLVASSPTVYGYGAPGGWMPRSLPLDEEHPTAPWHGYAASKEALERLVAMAARRDGDRLHLGVFRPCYVITPEEWAGALTQQGHTVRERLADPSLAAPALFNYLDARDAGSFVDAWLTGARQVPNGTVFLVGASDALATRPLSELVPRYVPGSEVVAAGLTGTRPAFDPGRAERLLGWRAMRSWRTELPADVVAALLSAAAGVDAAVGERSHADEHPARGGP